MSIRDYRPDLLAASRMAATRIRRQADPPQRQVTPQYRMATVITNDGTYPPTCTISYDITIPGSQQVGVRYVEGLCPQQGDLVYVTTVGGDAWIISKLRNDQLPAYIETTATLTGITSETFNTSTYLTVWLQTGHRYEVIGHVRPDSSTANVVGVRIRYGTGANPTTGSPIAAADEGAGNTGANGSRVFTPTGYPIISGVDGYRTFGMSVALLGGAGTVGMATGQLGVIYIAVKNFR